MNTTNLQQGEAPATAAVKSEREPRAYVEVPGLRPETKDVLKQLQSNIALLEDQCGRLSFLMTEIRSVIRR